MPVIATVRRVHTRAEGIWDTSDAVVQANQRAEPSVDTATSAAPADRWPAKYSAHTAIGNSPLTVDGVERAHICSVISRRWRWLRAVSRRARWSSTGLVAPASFTVRAADSDDTSAVANAARAATVRRAERSSRGPKSVAASPDTTIVPAKKAAGTNDREAAVIDTIMSTLMVVSIRL